MPRLLKTVVQDNSGYSGGRGQFKSFNDGVWQYCRVTFHEKYYTAFKAKGWASPGFLYMNSYKQTLQQILDCLGDVEKNLPLEDQVIVSPTQFENVYHYQPGLWWDDPVRLTLLSCILRDARGNVRETLQDGDIRYLGRTHQALEAFVGGATFYQEESYNGWYNSMLDNKEGIVKLKDKPGPEECNVIHHPGWNTYKMKLARR